MTIRRTGSVDVFGTLARNGQVTWIGHYRDRDTAVEQLTDFLNGDYGSGRYDERLLFFYGPDHYPAIEHFTIKPVATKVSYAVVQEGKIIDYPFPYPFPGGIRAEEVPQPPQVLCAWDGCHEFEPVFSDQRFCVPCGCASSYDQHRGLL